MTDSDKTETETETVPWKSMVWRLIVGVHGARRLPGMQAAAVGVPPAFRVVATLDGQRRATVRMRTQKYYKSA